MAIKGVFFDIFGTLVVSSDETAAWSDWADAFFETFHRYGCAVPRDLLREKCLRMFDVPAPPSGAATFSPYENRIRDFARRLAFEASLECVRDTASATVAAWKDYNRLDPDAVPVLNALLTQKKMAAISNFDAPSEVHKTIAKQGLARFFDTVVVSGEVGVEKPDPEIFHIGLKKLGLQPREVVHIGDSPEDVDGAMAAGCGAIRILREGDVRCSNGAATVIKSLTELPFVLREMEHRTVTDLL